MAILEEVDLFLLLPGGDSGLGWQRPKGSEELTSGWAAMGFNEFLTRME